MRKRPRRLRLPGGNAPGGNALGGFYFKSPVAQNAAVSQLSDAGEGSDFPLTASWSRCTSRKVITFAFPATSNKTRGAPRHS